MKILHYSALAALCFVLTACAEKKELPVTMLYRPALGPGYVQIFENKTNQQLRLWVSIKRGGTFFPDVIRSGELVLGPNEKREIGWLQGVALQQGDRIAVSHPDYKEGEWQIPRSFDR